MSEKRFIRNIVGDIYDSEKDKWFEEDWKGKPLDYDDDLIVFLNEQQALINALKKENKELKEDLKKGFDVPIPYVENSMRRLRAEHKVDEQQAEIERLKEQLSLVCKAESSSPYNSVKEVLRRQIFGLDCAAQESANAWNHYCVLSKLFEEQYGEYWDNFD